MVVLLAFCLLCFFQVANANLSCLDEAGKPVDSWTALKEANGWGYYYMSGSTWVRSKYGVDKATSGMIMLTAKQAYSTGVQMGIYNDEMAGASVSSSHAHAKGILATDGRQGFWLVHSMPKWPASKSGPGPFDSNRYAQSLMCITVSAKTADTIASNLMVENVFLTSKKAVPSFASSLPIFTKWLSGATDARTTSTTVIKTLGGASYYQMAKSEKWGKDLWDDLVAPYFKTPLYAETWRNGASSLPIFLSPSIP